MRTLSLWFVIAAAGMAAGPGLIVEVVEGDGAVYNLRGKHPAMPRVRVLDAGGQPVGGASVTFLLPDAGPGGIFTEGRIATVVAGDRGEAAVPTVKFNSRLGQWEIRVSASHQGQVGHTAIQQINAAPAGAMSVSGKKSRSLYVLAAAAAGAAALATVGVVSRGGSPAPPGSVGAATVAASTPLTISAGAGSVGAP